MVIVAAAQRTRRVYAADPRQVDVHKCDGIVRMLIRMQKVLRIAEAGNVKRKRIFVAESFYVFDHYFRLLGVVLD